MIFTESELVELKSEVVADICKEIIAFANTKGGTVYIGIADDGRFRMETNDLGKGCGVIRLHVVDDDEIQRSVGEKMV